MATQRKLQGSFEEIRVRDAALVGALDTIEQAERDTREIRESRAAAARPFSDQITAIEDNLGLADAKAKAAEREAVILEKHKDELVDGKQIRVGGYVLVVKEYQTMEKVEKGTGYKLTRPMRVEASDDAE